MTDIFVFGSNLGGAHGAGAAKVAHQRFGAVMGRPIGMQGSSYAIPTRYAPTRTGIKTLPLDKIEHFVSDFKKYASEHPDMKFNVTRIGCGFAGYMDEHMAPMFLGSPKNCVFDSAWKQYLGEEYTYHNGAL